MKEIAQRLTAARKKAGFASAQDAVNRFGWVYATYAGHENGHRGVRKEVLAEYARAFRVDLAWLLDGRTSENPRVAEPVEGMAEPAMTPFVARNDRQDQQLNQLVRTLCPGLARHQLWHAGRDYPGYAIRRGDLLIIGEPPEPQRGAVVLTTLLDEQTAASETVLRQAYGSTLAALPGDELADEGRLSAGILGTVLAVVRAPEAF
jgi:hypothetical protein